MPRRFSLPVLPEKLTGPLSHQRMRIAFKEYADAVHAAFCRAKRRDSALSPLTKPNSVLKLGAYRLIRHCRSLHMDEIIRDIVLEDGNEPPNGPTFAANPFHWGLLAMFPPQTSVDKDLRRLAAAQLLYAHLHDVPPPFLIGFIYQLGPTASVYGKLASRFREPWYDEWRAEMANLATADEVQ